MEQAGNCPYVAHDDIVPRYLRGKLDPAAAEAFEVHYFACQRCWEEVEAAAAIRSAAGAGARSSGPSRRSVVRRRLLLAAAASVAATAAILFPSSGRRDPVWRSTPLTSFEVSVAQHGAALRISWPAVEGAVTYRVDVMTAEGVVLASQDARSTFVEISKSAFEGTAPPPLYLRVQALEAPGKAIASTIQALGSARR